MTGIEEAIMTVDEQKVWQVLCTCRGRNMAILGPEIEALTEIKYKQVQKIIAGLVCHHGKMIGSGTCGYYIPITVQEYSDATYYIRHRAIVALDRVSKMQHVSLEEIFNQSVLEFENVK
jgi:hypothetical protein